MISAQCSRVPGAPVGRGRQGLPELVSASDPLMTVAEVGKFLRTSRKAVYTMIERGQLPGVLRINRRVLVNRDVLLDWLRQKSTPSLER